MRQPRLTACGQAYPAGLPIKKLRIDPKFEISNALAHGRLSQTKLSRGRREAAEPRRSLEHPQPFERREILIGSSHKENGVSLPVSLACSYARFPM